ncbi:unnamed protein product [Chrysodeixis includens]|uniref:Uncharacterized protein n=1 Tax=Chrysodeixis includens TaxID=689277 RepID=A0A9N8L062_CHRIL|nr:unnamed protein product [Chrysodeixis includens]
MVSETVPQGGSAKGPVEGPCEGPSEGPCEGPCVPAPVEDDSLAGVIVTLDAVAEIGQETHQFCIYSVSPQHSSHHSSKPHSLRQYIQSQTQHMQRKTRQQAPWLQQHII